jgi:uncharacterized DUF497 family protein
MPSLNERGQLKRKAHAATRAEVSATELHIRVISARRADPVEVRDYERMPL